MPSKPSLYLHRPLSYYSTHISTSWGRILCAIGYAPVSRSCQIHPHLVSVSLVDPSPTAPSPTLPLLRNGEPEKVDEVRAKQILQNEDIEIRVTLGIGKASAKYWTCDFSHVSAVFFFCWVGEE